MTGRVPCRRRPRPSARGGAPSAGCGYTSSFPLRSGCVTSATAGAGPLPASRYSHHPFRLIFARQEARRNSRGPCGSWYSPRISMISGLLALRSFAEAVMIAPWSRMSALTPVSRARFHAVMVRRVPDACGPTWYSAPMQACRPATSSTSWLPGGCSARCPPSNRNASTWS